MKPKLIIDCDPGIDDAEAILMALCYPDIVELVAVMTVFGNSTIENTTINALRILKFADRLDIPVYRGCSFSVSGVGTVNDNFHRVDGLGDVTLPNVDPLDEQKLIQAEHASVALCRFVNTYPGEVIYVAIGPLTNLAIALNLDPLLGSKLQRCVVMGGNIQGVGNITRSAEFNFYSDPEAADCVLNRLGCLLELIPIEICDKYTISWDTYNERINQKTETASFLRMIGGAVLTWKTKLGFERYPIWDQLAILAVLKPESVLETELRMLSVECGGHLTRGQAVATKPRAKFRNLKPNVKILKKFDALALEELYDKLIASSSFAICSNSTS